MSKCLLSYAFFADGRADAFAEVRILRDLGLWTKEKRARWIKEAVASRARLVHTHRSQGASYFAGRLAALKSRQTAPVSESKRPVNQSRAATVFRPLAPQTERFCSLFDCGSDAVWGACLQGDTEPFVLLCDPCRQEWQRAETAYTTPDGWYWDEEMLPALPSHAGKKLESLFIFAPTTAIVGLGVLDLTLQVPISLFVLQALFVLSIALRREVILHLFLKWLES